MKPDLDPDALDLMPTIGVCDKCGRGFVTMPKDGRDHYLLRKGGDVICMGDVKRVPNTDRLVTIRPLTPEDAKGGGK